MLSYLIRNKVTTFRNIHKPLAYLKKRESNFYEPPAPYKTELEKKATDFATQDFRTLKQKINNNEKIKSIKPSMARQILKHPYKKLDAIFANVKIDPNYNFIKNVGIEELIQDVLQGGKTNYKPFVEFFDSLADNLAFKSDYELLATFSHSIALRTSSDYKDQAKGILLKIAVEKIVPDFSSKNIETKEIELSTLTDKIALNLVMRKIKEILNARQKNSSYQRADLLDFFLRDSMNPNPSEKIKQNMQKQVYNLSGMNKEDLGETISDSIDEKIERNYFNAKARVLCNFLGISEEKIFILKNGSVELLDVFQFYQKAQKNSNIQKTEANSISELVENEMAQNNDSSIKMKVFLKNLLSHADVLNTIDRKVLKLEDELNLVSPDRPTSQDVERLLDLLIFNLPTELKKDLKLSQDMTGMRYVNHSFNSLQLQWNALDLQIPAKIMNTADHQRYLALKYFEGELADFYDKDNQLFYDRVEQEELLRIVDPVKVKVGTHNLSAKGAIIQKSPIGYIEDIDEALAEQDFIRSTKDERTQRLIDAGEEMAVDEQEEEETDETSQMTLESVNEFYQKLKEAKKAWKLPDEYQEEKKPRRKIFKRISEEDEEAPEFEEEELEENQANELDVAEVEDGPVVSLEDPRIENSVFQGEIFELRKQARDNERMFKDLSYTQFVENEIENMEKEFERMETESTAPHPIIDELSQPISESTAKNLSVFERIQMSGLTETEKYASLMNSNENKSVQLYRQLQEPIYYKHYVAHSYRKGYEDNPYDNMHFLDDDKNPNLGIFYDVNINSQKLGNDSENPIENFRGYRSKLSVVSSNGKKNGMMENKNIGVSTNPNFVTGKNTIIDMNLHKLRPQELEELQKPKLNFFGQGRRKESKAIAVITTPGTGKIKVNNRELIEYFIEETCCYHVVLPIRAANKLCEIDVQLYLTGGGITGQSQAASLAVSKALVRAYPELYQVLHEGYFFYSDNRQVEAKKTGRYKARKSWTYVRR